MLTLEPWALMAAAAVVSAASVIALMARRQAAALQIELAQRHEQLIAARAEHAALARDNQWLEASDRKLRETFQSLAADALKDNRASFLDLAKSSFEQYHQPISETLKKVDLRLSEAERDRVVAYSKLTEQVMALGSSANRLSRALHAPAVRGRWGEMQLRRVVEIAGMLQRCDFDEQPGLYTDNGRMRPDLVVHLPGAKQIVVDAKAPLEAFLDAQETQDDEARAVSLQAHARQVRDHMDKLGSKAYWDQLGNSPEMVVMFLPGETLFSAALQHDLTLIEHGLRQQVLLASPITLIALLTTVAHSWRQEALTENYREVAQLGKELYERLATFIEHFDDVRKKLDGAVQAYNRAAGSFETRVAVSARKLKDLNVTTAGDLPPLEPIDAIPRVLRQANLMGLPESATADEPELDSQLPL
ncbi:MAG TPA: DNA recombination protein RmuC [Vicinamibacterales bacterium]